ncbi:MAG: hypothetical protein FJW31_26445 [Acidobacteria bacterium]|nr:hypothetical protein [Acidobacteriota bacterium]
MNRIMLFFAAALFCAAAEDATGSWTMKMPGPSGDTVEVAMTLKMESEKLAGSIAFPNRTLEISEGKADGANLDFVIKRDRGNGGAPVVYKMKATVEGAAMKGTAETDMMGSPMKINWTAAHK